uniref:PDZ domain-containing protein n=1 Tax=Oryzias latipes TaxID=8090 RepID=A0A3B3HSG9_ORYLA
MGPGKNLKCIAVQCDCTTHQGECYTQINIDTAPWRKYALSHTLPHTEPLQDEPSPEPELELLPRLCHLLRGEEGYGFNLHSDKKKTGQFVRTVDPNSPAERAGVRPGDKIVEVNGVNIGGLRHSEVVELIKSRGNEVRLLVVDQETDELFHRLQITPTGKHITANGSSASHSSRSSTTQSEISSSEMNPFIDSGLSLSPTAAEAKRKVLATRQRRRAPPMDWSKKQELFSNF